MRKLLIISLLFYAVGIWGAGVELTSKVAPKNDGFVGMVDSDQVIDEGDLIISTWTTTTKPYVHIATNSYTLGYSSAAFFYGDGSNLTGISGGSGSPGGSNEQIQYNNSSSFGGISGFTFDGTTVAITIPLEVSAITWPDGTVQVSSPPAGGGGGSDNLGNHTATQNLDMATYNIDNIGEITLSTTNVTADVERLVFATHTYTVGYSSGTDFYMNNIYWNDGTIQVSSPSAAGVTDHTLLTSTGTNTHDQIDSQLSTLDTSTTTLRVDVDLNTTHRSSDGSDHTFIDQDVTNGSAPTFTANNLSDGGSNAIITTTQETNFESASTHVSNNGSDHGFIDQDVTNGSSPIFSNANMTGNISVWTNDTPYLTESSATATYLQQSSATATYMQKSLGTTQGDVLYYDGGWQRLGIGTAGEVLEVSAGGIPEWDTDDTIANQNLWQTMAGDTGSVIADSPTNTFTITGGLGIDTGITDHSIQLDFDPNDLGGTPTWGSGTGITWTFNASGGTDPSFAFADNSVTINATTTTVTNIIGSEINVSTINPNGTGRIIITDELNVTASSSPDIISSNTIGNVYMRMTATSSSGLFGTISADDWHLQRAGASKMSITSTGVKLTSNLDMQSFQINVATMTGIVNAGSATSLEIPNGANPTVDESGEIAWDSNDDAIEVYSTVYTDSMLNPTLQDIDKIIYAPDYVNDQIPIMHVDADLYPHGIKIVNVQITLPADAAYSMVFEEWAGDPPVAQNNIETVTTTASDSYMEVTGASIDDSDIDADDYIFLDIPNNNVDWILCKIIYYVKHGN